MFGSSRVFVWFRDVLRSGELIYRRVGVLLVFLGFIVLSFRGYVSSWFWSGEYFLKGEKLGLEVVVGNY